MIFQVCRQVELFLWVTRDLDHSIRFLYSFGFSTVMMCTKKDQRESFARALITECRWKHLYLTLLLSFFVFVACGILSLVFLLGIAFCRCSWPSPELIEPEHLDDVPKTESKEPYLEVSVPKQFLLRVVPRMSQVFQTFSEVCFMLSDCFPMVCNAARLGPFLNF